MDLSIIQSKIRIIRGRKVLLDFDLAEMYETETSQLKRQVRRNIKRFEGDDFMFEVTREELSRCQIGTLKKGRGSNIKYLPFAFTELGVAMLSSVLESDKAIEVNRDVMRAFVLFRHYASELSELKRQLEDYQINTTMQIAEILDIINEMAIKQNVLYQPPTTVIGFKTLPSIPSEC